MATLEKIRSKAALLTIVIGVALVAFILGDFLSNGRTLFGNTNMAAQVGSKKIDIQEFQKRYEEESQMMQQNNQSVDPALVQQQVLNGMIQEILLDKEVEDLDIYVSQEELTEAMVGKNANPRMVQFAQQMGAQTPAQLYDMIFNPSNYGIPEESIAPARAEWMKRENEMEKTLQYMKLANLITGAVQANDLDKNALYAENASTSNIIYAKKEYSSLKDDDFKVTDAEINALYNKNKEKYKLDTDMRRIHYIAVDIKPSATDEAAAQKVVEDAVAILKSKPGIDDIRNNSDLSINQRVVRASDINDPQVKEFILTSEVEALTPVKHIGDTYSLTKLIGKKVETDSVKMNMVGVEGNKTLQDSVLKMLNAGKPIADIQKIKGVTAQMDMWQSIMQAGAESQEIKTKILGAGAEYFALNSSDQGAMLLQVTEKKAPKQMYEIAEVSYKVFPSETTIQNLRDNLQTYITQNNTNKTFTEKAIPAGYQAVETVITPASAQIDRIPYTRKAIQWAFGGEVGNVSSIFDKESNNKMVVVAIDEVIEEGYTPVTDKDLRTALTNEIIRDKKAENLMSQYKGKAKDIAGYAQVMSTSVDTTSVTFAQPYIPMIGMEPALLGRVPVAKTGELVGPVKGNFGVYVFQVTGKNDQAPSLTPAQSGDRFSAIRGGQAVMQKAVDILRNSTEVKNEMIKFY